MPNPRLGSNWTPSRWARRGRYADYVQSKAWARRRLWWFEEHRRRTGEEPACAVCDVAEVDLHHMDYARIGGEDYGDLIAYTMTASTPPGTRRAIYGGSGGELQP